MAVLEGEKLIPSGNGFAFLENFTKEVYGDRGRFDSNLERYFIARNGDIASLPILETADQRDIDRTVCIFGQCRRRYLVGG